MADQAEKLRNIIKAQNQPRRQAARVITVTSGYSSGKWIRGSLYWMRISGLPI